MRAYLGWSGPRGRAVATAVARLLRQADVDLWSADNGLSSGAIDTAGMHQRLTQTDVAIICVTFEERGADLLVYQVGACLQALARDRSPAVYLSLLDLEPEDLPSVLSSCTSTGTSRTGVARLLAALQSLDGVDRSAAINAWPTLDTELESARQMLPPASSRRHEVSEILALVRRLVSDRDGGQIATISESVPVVKTPGEGLDWGETATTSIAQSTSTSADLDFDFAPPTELQPGSPSAAPRPGVPSVAEVHLDTDRSVLIRSAGVRPSSTIDDATLRSQIDGHRATLTQLAGFDSLRSVVAELLCAFEQHRVADYRLLLGKSYRVLLARGEPIASEVNAWFDAVRSSLDQAGV